MAHSKKILSLVLIAFIFSKNSLASDLNQSSAQEALQSLAQKIQSVEKNQPDLLNKMKLAWNKKCQKKPDGCFIHESDVFADGKKDSILLFRGEPGIYSYPGTSNLWRSAATHTHFCSTPCLAPDVLKNTLAKLQELLTFDVIEMSRMTLSPVAFSLTENKWKLIETQSTQFVLADLQNPIRDIQKVGTLPQVAINQQHIDGTFLPIVDENGVQTKFDPYVSLSSNPAVAFKYATQNKPSGSASRLIVVAYHESQVKNVLHSDCRSWAKQAAELVNISECSSGEIYQSEYEYDAALQLDPESIRASLLLN